jgi:RimJ/RimL family protein N-acetyltransferase
MTTTDAAPAEPDGPVFPAAPPEHIGLPDGLALVRCDPGLARAAVEAVNASLDHLRPWMAWVAEPATEVGMATFFALSAELWDQRRDFGYTILDPVTEAVAGGCGLHARLGTDGLEIGYWVHVDRAGQGVATEVARALTDAAFTVPGVHRMRIQCEEANLASARVPAKLGYRFAGIAVSGEGPCTGRSTQTWLLDETDWHGGRTKQP